jgi:thioredoxin reductase
MTGTDVVIVGDGPTGLSAALLLEKNDLDTVVLGENETPIHKALLLNYLGLEEEEGTPFIERARKQAAGFGADLREAHVTSVSTNGDGFEAETEDGQAVTGRYLVLATGTDRSLAEELGLSLDGDVIEADKEGRTSEEGVFAGGWATRPHKIQAATSVGDGAAIALTILSEEAGEPMHDFDVVG